MLAYWETDGGISAGRLLGGLLDAGADAAVVAGVLARCPVPRGTLFASRSLAGGVRCTVVTLALAPVPQGTMLIEAIVSLENSDLPLAVRTWGGGALRRLVEAEALVRGIAVDAVPLDDPLSAAEIIAVAAALATLRVVRVYAAPIAVSSQPSAASAMHDVGGNHAHAAAVVRVLLEEAAWPLSERKREEREGEKDESGEEPSVADGWLLTAARTTPTGAALLVALAEPEMPPLRLVAVGYGAEAAGEQEGGAGPFAVWLGEPYGTRAVAGGDIAHDHPHPHAPGNA